MAPGYHNHREPANVVRRKTGILAGSCHPSPKKNLLEKKLSLLLAIAHFFIHPIPNTMSKKNIFWIDAPNFLYKKCVPSWYRREENRP